jgi:hypothetical protein
MAYPNSVVNDLLRVVGLTTVNRVDLTDSDTFDAVNVLIGIDKKLQTKGLWFNRDYDVRLPVDADGHLILSPLTLDVTFSENRYIQRGRKVYDRFDQTFKFTEPMTLVSLVTLINYDECPPVYQAALTAEAKKVHFSNIDGDPTVLQELIKEEREAAFELKAKHLKKARVSAINTNFASRLLAGMPISPTTSQFGNVLGGSQWRARE